MDITDRKRQILKAIIENYIETAEPVGSKVISERSELHLSSATIRNEMSDLEALGYLEQPHTSSGRIPSPKGYRIFVDELMHRHRLSIEETERMNAVLNLRIQELDRLISEAGRIISALVRYPTYALTPKTERVTIKRFDLIMVEESAFIIVVMTDTNVIKNKLVRLPLNLDSDDLILLVAALNRHLTGLTVNEITHEHVAAAQRMAGEAGSLVPLVLSYAIEILNGLRDNEVYLTGASQILDQPEFKDIFKAKKLLDYLSDRSEVKRLPEPEQSEDVRIMIGPENVAAELQDASAIVASYNIGDNMRGLIGVVGPTRMDYAKVAAKLSYFAINLNKLLKSPDE